MIYLGIDPGKSGGIAVNFSDDLIQPEGRPLLATISMKETEHDIAQWLKDNALSVIQPVRAVIEKVGATPQMGVVSAFTFGRSYGFLLGALATLEISYAFVTPQKWQKAMGCLSKGDKNVTKAAAQRLYPNERITHSVADALLLATYCRRYHRELF